MRNRPVKERFERKFRVTPGCWIWTDAKRRGYGRFRVGDSKVTASRYSYELYVGPIPEGMDILHRCDNPCCVNPDHLLPGTHDENMLDMVEKCRNSKNRGESNSKAKLTVEQVLEIRADPRSQGIIAKKYGVGQALIWKIKHRTLWRHV